GIAETYARPPMAALAAAMGGARARARPALLRLQLPAKLLQGFHHALVATSGGVPGGRVEVVDLALLPRLGGRNGGILGQGLGGLTFTTGGRAAVQYHQPVRLLRQRLVQAGTLGLLQFQRLRRTGFRAGLAARRGFARLGGGLGTQQLVEHTEAITRRMGHDPAIDREQRYRAQA